MAELSAELVRGMDAACAFAADRAAAKAPVATGLTKRDVSYEVRTDGLDVIGRVGVRKGRGHAWYAAFLEFGTSKLAAQPWLRPAVWQNRKQIMRLLTGK